MKVSNSRHILASWLLIVLLAWPAAMVHANSAGVKNSQTIPPEKIRSAVQAYIAGKAPWDPEQMTIKAIKFNRPVVAPKGNVTINVTAPKHTDWLGAIPFTVAVAVNGQRAGRFMVPVNLQVWSDIIMTTKPMGRFQPIERDDIQIKRMDLARVPSNVLVNIDQVLGRRASRNISANCILRSDHVEFPPIVKRGDLVHVVAETTNLKISVKALAKENGRKGDRIKVMNLRSKKAIYALVVDDQTVRVDY